MANRICHDEMQKKQTLLVVLVASISAGASRLFGRSTVVESGESGYVAASPGEVLGSLRREMSS